MPGDEEEGCNLFLYRSVLCSSEIGSRLELCTESKKDRWFDPKFRIHKAVVVIEHEFYPLLTRMETPVKWLA